MKLGNCVKTAVVNFKHSETLLDGRGFFSEQLCHDGISYFHWFLRHTVSPSCQQLTNRKAGPSVFQVQYTRGTCDIECGSKHAEELAKFERPTVYVGTLVA